MPRVLPKPRFADDDLVHAIEPFTGTLDGASFVCNPSTTLRGDDPVVRAYPQFFARQGDRQAVAEYHNARYAEEAAERARHDAEEQERRKKERERVEKLADKLEVEERKRREREREETQAWWREQDAKKRQRGESEEQRAEEARIRALAEAEVARRLAADEADAA